MEFIRFIFSSFWVWFGFFLLIFVLGGIILSLVKELRKGKTIRVYPLETGGQGATIERATKADVKWVVKYIKGETEEGEKND